MHSMLLLLCRIANLTNNYLSWRILSYKPPRSGLNVVPRHASCGYLNTSSLMPPGALEMASSDLRSRLPENDMSVVSFSCGTGVKTIVVFYSIAHAVVPNLSRLHYDRSSGKANVRTSGCALPRPTAHEPWCFFGRTPPTCCTQPS
jgi:hypothetical protein